MTRAPEDASGARCFLGFAARSTYPRVAGDFDLDVPIWGDGDACWRAQCPLGLGLDQVVSRGKRKLELPSVSSVHGGDP